MAEEDNSSEVRRRHALRTYYAVTDAFCVAQEDGAVHKEPALQDAAKILEALLITLRELDDDKTKALRDGTKWARTLAPGGRAPQSEFVRKLHKLVSGVKLPWNDERVRYISKDAAFEVSVSGLAPCRGIDDYYASIRERLRAAADRDKADGELLVKEILRSFLSEEEAGRWVHGARLSTDPDTPT